MTYINANSWAKNAIIKIKQQCEDLQNLELNHIAADLLCLSSNRKTTLKSTARSMSAQTSRSFNSVFKPQQSVRSTQKGKSLNRKLFRSNNNIMKDCTWLTSIENSLTWKDNSHYCQYNAENDHEDQQKIQFLKKLFVIKMKEMKTKSNPKTQLLFRNKMLQKISDYNFIVPNCDLGPLCLKYISANLLNYFSKLKIIILDKNPINDEGIVQLSKVLSKIPIQNLSLVSINMTYQGSPELIKSLTGIKTLTKLNLSSCEGLNRNKLGKNGLNSMKQFFWNENNILNEINLTNDRMSNEGWVSLCEGVQKGKHLRNLYAGMNQIGPSALLKFSSTFTKVPLVILDLSYNQIGDAGLNILTQLLGLNYHLTKISKSLKILNISGNTIKAIGIDNFCKGMASNQTLEEFIFNDNQFANDEWLSSFCNFLSRNFTLKKLSLCRTLSTNDQIIMILKSLEQNKSIQKLMLSKNSFDKDSFDALSNLLSKSKFLKKIELNSCNITDQYIINSERKLFQVKNLEEIELQNNFVCEKGARIFQRMVYKSNKLVRINLKHNCIKTTTLNVIEKATKYNQQQSQYEDLDGHYFQKIDQIQMEEIIVLQNTNKNYRERLKKLEARKIIHTIALKEENKVRKWNELLDLEKEIATLKGQTPLKDNIVLVEIQESNQGSEIHSVETEKEVTQQLMLDD